MPGGDDVKNPSNEGQNPERSSQLDSVQYYPDRFLPLEAASLSGAGTEAGSIHSGAERSTGATGESPKSAEAISSWSRSLPTAWPNPTPSGDPTATASGSTTAFSQSIYSGEKAFGFGRNPLQSITSAHSLPQSGRPSTSGVDLGQGGGDAEIREQPRSGRGSSGNEERRAQNRAAEQAFEARSGVMYDLATSQERERDVTQHLANLEAQTRMQQAKINEQALTIKKLTAENDLLRKAGSTISRRGIPRPSGMSSTGSSRAVSYTETGAGGGVENLMGTSFSIEGGNLGGPEGRTSEAETSLVGLGLNLTSSSTSGSVAGLKSIGSSSAVDRFLAKRREKRERDRSKDDGGRKED